MGEKLRGTTVLAGFLLLAFLFFSAGAAPQVQNTSTPSSKSISREPLAGNRTVGEHSLPALPKESLFEAVIKWIKAGGIAKGERSIESPLRVDPHPLRADFDKSGGIMALDLKESDFAEADSAVLQQRRAILRRLGVPHQQAMPYYHDCLMTWDPEDYLGTDSTYTVPADGCGFTAVAVSFSRPVSTGEGGGNCKDCRTVQFVTLSSTSFQTYKLIVQRRVRSFLGWKVISVENVNGIKT